MKEWLSKDFTPLRNLAGEMAGIAIKRGKARRRNERIALLFCSFLFVGLLSFVAVNSLREAAPAQSRHSESNAFAVTHEESPVPGLLPSDGAAVGAIHELPVLKPQDDVRAGHASPNNIQKGEEFVVRGFNLAQTRDESRYYERARDESRYYEHKGDIPIQFQKIDHSVAISWDGEGKYAIYKCGSPQFDSCSIMEIVEGNSWLDKDENSGKIVYYRVEPLGGKG